MVGQTLGSYRVVRQIGAGGMGNVYQAQHQLIGRMAAIKVLQPQYSKDPEFVSRFFNEARATTQIRHPGIVEVIDYGYHPSGAAYLVMEFLEGETLATRLKRERRIPAWLMSVIVRQMAAAIGAAHAAGIVHRDLKPENVFLVPERGAPAGTRVKILDFGVAKVQPSANNPSFTRADSMLGTPHYMSPEQCRGAAGADWRSDIYALGCILFEMLTGRKVFIAQGLGELLAMHQRQPPPTLASIDPGTPPELDKLLGRMLAKRPEERPQSMEEVELALESLAGTYGWDAQWSRTSGAVASMAVGAAGLGGIPSHAGPLPQGAYPSHAGSIAHAPSHGGPSPQSRSHVGSLAGHPRSQVGPLPVPAAGSGPTPGDVHPVVPSGAAAIAADEEVGSPPRPRPTALWVAAAVVILGAAGGGLFVLRRGRAPSEGEPPAAAPTRSAAPPSTSPPPAAAPPLPAAVPTPVAAEVDAIVAVPLPSVDALDAGAADTANAAGVEEATTTPDAAAAAAEPAPTPASDEAPRPRPKKRRPDVEL